MGWLAKLLEDPKGPVARILARLIEQSIGLIVLGGVLYALYGEFQVERERSDACQEELKMIIREQSRTNIEIQRTLEKLKQ